MLRDHGNSYLSKIEVPAVTVQILLGTSLHPVWCPHPLNETSSCLICPVGLL